MVAFTGTCLVHRAEIMQLHGAWPDALEEARRAGERFAQAMNQPAAAQALLPAGRDPSPAGRVRRGRGGVPGGEPRGSGAAAGLALLRLAQGDGDAAAAAIRRVVGETAEPPKRAAAAARLRRDHAGGRRRRGGAQRLPRARGDRDAATRAGCWARWRRTPGARSTWPRATPRPPWSRCGTRGAGVAGARGAVRGRARARARRDWPAARSATTSRPRWSSTPPAPASHELGAAPDLARVGLARRARRLRRRSWADRARAAGAAPGRRRRDQQGDRRRAGPQRADRRPAREQHLRQARVSLARRGHGLRVRAPSSSEHLAWVELPTPPAGASWVVPPMRRASAAPIVGVQSAHMPSEEDAMHDRITASRLLGTRVRLAGLPVTERRLTLAGISTAVLEGGDGPADGSPARPRGVRGASGCG